MNSPSFVLVVFFLLQTAAMACWPLTPIDKKQADKLEMPISVEVVRRDKDLFEIKYDFSLVDQFEYLRSADIIVSRKEALIFSMTIVESPIGETPDAPVVGAKGKFLVDKEHLKHARLHLHCPVKPNNLSGQTYVIDLASYYGP